jgi:hypothetical protein
LPQFSLNGKKIEIIDSLDNFYIHDNNQQVGQEQPQLNKKFSDGKVEENFSFKSETPEIKQPISNSMRDRQKMFDRSSTIVQNSNKKLEKILPINRGNSTLLSKYESNNNSLSSTFENKYKTLNIPDKKENSSHVFNRGSTFSDRLKFLEKGGDKNTAVKENRHVKKFSDFNNSFSEQEENFLKNAMKSLRSSENCEAGRDNNTEKDNPLRKSIKITQMSEKLEEKLNCNHMLNVDKPDSREIFIENEPSDDYQNMISEKALIKNVKRKKGKKAF